MQINSYTKISVQSIKPDIIPTIRRSLLFALVFTLCVLANCNLTMAQNFIGKVLDESTGSALPFASVSVYNSSKGTISNEDGFFSLELTEKDSVLLVSFIGYKTRKILNPIGIGSSIVALSPIDVALDQFIVLADDGYIKGLISKVQKKLRQSSPIDSKAYMKVQSDELNSPIELVECYYNATSNQSGVLELALKNGRAGLYIENGRSYHSMSSSKFFEEFNIANKRDFMPYNPFQLRKGELSRFYTFQLLSTIGDSLSHVSFESIESKSNFFSGDVWIDVANAQIKQLNLTIEDASYFPLKPIWSGDKLETINMNASLNFDIINKAAFLSHIEFTYSFDYVHDQNTDYDISGPDQKRKIIGSGLVYLYDYDNKFILPSYSYDDGISDYNKISLASVNSDFWKLNLGLPPTKIEKQKLAYFGQKGLLLNHFTQNNELQRHMDNVQYTLASILWRDSIRINVLYDINTDTIPKHTRQMTLHQNYYNLEVQIYLDINETENGIQYFSATVLDAIKTYYILPKEDYSNAFINIYFDICEIERRKMEAKINKEKVTIKRLQKTYAEAMLNLHEVTGIYLKEVDRGRERNKLSYWNDYVDKELGINNFELFGMSLD